MDSREPLKLPTGVTIRAHKSGKQSIQIAFTYEGRQCREVLPGRIPNKTNLKYAGDLVARIRSEIGEGTFDYLERFPKSKQARRLTITDDETVAALLNQYLDDQRESVTPSTWDSWKSMVRSRIIPGIGERKVSELKVNHIAAWLKSSAMSSLSLKYVRNVITPLRGALYHAIHKGVRDDNPAASGVLQVKSCVKKPFWSTGWEPDPLNVDEIRKLLAGCEANMARNLFQVAFETGLRTGELIALRWDDVDLKLKQLTVERAIVDSYEKGTKTKKGMRVVDLSKAAISAFQDQRRFTGDTGTIFRHPHTLLALRNSNQVRTLWVRAVEKAEIRYRSPYQTRHTYASQMITRRRNLNLFYLADQMGHVGIEMINRHYGRWIRDNDKRARPDRSRNGVIK